MSSDKELEKVADFFFELKLLKNVKRSGWWVAGVKDPESVADHGARAAIIAYVLAKLEKCDAYKSALMVMVHDIPETRLADKHKIAQRYIDLKPAEKVVIKDQVKELPKDIKDDLLDVFNDYRDDSSKEGIVARDADLLECAFTAKEYLELGYKVTQDWIDKVRGLLKTESAKKLLKIMEKKDSDDWWHGLKEIKR